MHEITFWATSVGNTMSKNEEKLNINTNTHEIANAPEEHRDKSDGELTNEKDELRKITQDTKRYKTHVERKSNDMKDDDASKYSSETYVSILKKGLRSKN